MHQGSVQQVFLREQASPALLVAAASGSLPQQQGQEQTSTGVTSCH